MKIEIRPDPEFGADRWMVCQVYPGGTFDILDRDLEKNEAWEYYAELVDPDED